MEEGRSFANTAEPHLNEYLLKQQTGLKTSTSNTLYNKNTVKKGYRNTFSQ